MSKIGFGDVCHLLKSTTTIHNCIALCKISHLK